MTRKQSLTFGTFEFDPVRGLLVRDGRPLILGARGAALLHVLLKRRGEVIEKGELIDAAWPDVCVEEANLSVQIGLLRRRLGRAPDGREWIATVQRVGYRFLPALEARATALNPVLAILPFADFDTGAQSEADAFVEDLTTALARFKSISVVARKVSFERRERTVDPRQFAAQLGADYVVEGSLRRLGERLRANIRLIDGTTGSHLWADTFDLASSTDEVVGRIAGLIEPKIGTAEVARLDAVRPEGSSPYDLYLRGRRLLRLSTEKDNAAGYRLLHRALQLAPENIHILAAVCEALHHRVAVGLPAITSDDRKETLDLARRGLALGIDDAGALALFSHSLFVAREWDLARLTMERAVEANPNDSRALSCAGQGALFLVSNKAEDYYQRALAFGPSDPNRHFTLNGLAVIERRRGNYEAAIQLAKSAVAICPGFSGAHWQLITATAYAGRTEEARRHLARYRAVAPGATLTSIGTGQPIVDERMLNHLLDGLAEAGLPETTPTTASA